MFGRTHASVIGRPVAMHAMRGVSARYPAFDAASGRPVNLEQRINLSRQQDQKAPPFAYESKEMLALSAYVALQSRGEPIEAHDDPRLKPFIDKGRNNMLNGGGTLFLGSEGSMIGPGI
jgi:sulfur-oxidizing protein SoxA